MDSYVQIIVNKLSIKDFDNINLKIFDKIDFVSDALSDHDIVLAWTIVICVLITNGPVITMLLKQASMTFLDKIVVLDCCMCMVNGWIAIDYMYSISLPVWFFLIPFFTTFWNVLIILVIITYRLVYILRSTWVQTKRQRYLFHTGLIMFLVITSLTMTGLCYYYRDFYLKYHSKFINSFLEIFSNMLKTKQ